MSQVRTSVVDCLVDETSVLDVLTILLVPGILAIVYAVPETIKREYVFVYSDPTPVTAFTSHFVHFTEAHLFANILGYLFIVMVAYAFALASDRRQHFVSFVVAGIVGLPFAISALNLALVRPRIGYGFSPVVMGFLGFLPIAATGFLHARVSKDFGLNDAPVFFFVGMGIITTRSTQGPTTYLILVLILSIVIFYLATILDDFDRPEKSLAVWIGEHRGEVTLLGIGTIVFCGMAVLAFPTDAVQGGTITNLYSHMLGYSLGFIAPYISFQLVARLE